MNIRPAFACRKKGQNKDGEEEINWFVHGGQAGCGIFGLRDFRVAGFVIVLRSTNVVILGGIKGLRPAYVTVDRVYGFNDFD